MIQKFKSRKEVSSFLKEKGIDTTNWSEEKWLSINKGQAEIHMMALAEAMWDAYNESVPESLVEGMWHIPYMSNIDSSKLKSMRGIDVTKEMIKISTAMCARVSYTVVGEEGKEPNYENDIKLHDRLAASGHASPFEHIAQASNTLDRSRNFIGGWKQYREMMNL